MKRILLSLLVLSFSVSASVKISSYNIRNFGKSSNKTNKTHLKSIISSLKSDLIATQEIYDNNGFHAFVRNEFPNYKLELSACGGGGKQNIGLMYNPSTLTLEKLEEDNQVAAIDGVMTNGCYSLRPALIGHFKVNKTKKKFTAVVLHLKAGGNERSYEKRKKQYRYLKTLVSSLKRKGHKNIVLLGDMNTTGWDDRDIDFRNFDNLLSHAKLTSVSEQLGCTSYWTGHDRGDGLESPSVLDHILYTGNFLGLKVKEVSVGSHCEKAKCQEVGKPTLGTSYSSVSDHCPISAKFN